MQIRAKVNPANLTEIWFTWDGREPMEDDNDFGADFYFDVDYEEQTIKAVTRIASYVNTSKGD